MAKKMRKSVQISVNEHHTAGVQDGDATLTPEEVEHHGRCTACRQLYSSAQKTRSALELKAWRAQIAWHLRADRPPRVGE
jgi:hypothetical protein